MAEKLEQLYILLLVNEYFKEAAEVKGFITKSNYGFSEDDKNKIHRMCSIDGFGCFVIKHFSTAEEWQCFLDSIRINL